jgi:hypothetical protein
LPLPESGRGPALPPAPAGCTASRIEDNQRRMIATARIRERPSTATSTSRLYCIYRIEDNQRRMIATARIRERPSTSRLYCI